MQDYLRRAINISRKTGDRLIVVDTSKKDDGYVVMRLDEYEEIIDNKEVDESLTEDELLDKINRDIAFMKEDENVSEINSNNNEISEVENSESDDIDEDIFYFEEEKPVNENINSESQKKSTWKIPSNIKDGAEEVIE